MPEKVTYIAIDGFWPEELTDDEAEELVAQVHSTVQENTKLRTEGVAVVDDVRTELSTRR